MSLLLRTRQDRYAPNGPTPTRLCPGPQMFIGPRPQMFIDLGPHMLIGPGPRSLSTAAPDAYKLWFIPSDFVLCLGTLVYIFGLLVCTLFVTSGLVVYAFGLWFMTLDFGLYLQQTLFYVLGLWFISLYSLCDVELCCSVVGKTYTMVGDESPLRLGMIPSAISWLFRLINEQKQHTGARFSVRVSAVEVTGKQEVLKDLLADIAASSSSGQYLAPGITFRLSCLSVSLYLSLYLSICVCVCRCVSVYLTV